MIHRILNPGATTIKDNFNEINKFFNKTAERISEKSLTQTININNFVKSLPDTFFTNR